LKIRDILTDNEKQRIERFIKRMKKSSYLDDYSDYKASIALILRNALSRVNFK